MKAKFIKIRYKIISSYVLSAILSGASMILVSIICIIAFNNKIVNLLRWLNSHVIAIPIILSMMMIMFFILMSVFFLILTQRGTNYLEEITQTLQTIASGNLDINIPVRSNDELGEIAKTINNITIKLKSLLEEERSWEKGKRELITNISHDLRTPLTSILGYVELISKHTYQDELKLQQYTEIIHKKCTQLNNLIDDLYQYSKLNSRELSINKININLVELLEQVMMGFIPILEEHKMEYKISLAKASVLILGDPILLARLFDNLISNAIKYGKHGKYIDIEMLEESNEVIIKVTNYGEDIPAKNLSHIFDRLYQVEKSRSLQNGGTGLGLAIVKSIIEIHDGKVNVNSKDGKTVFEVRLPISERDIK